MVKMFKLINRLKQALKEGRIKEAIEIEEELHKVISTYKDAC